MSRKSYEKQFPQFYYGTTEDGWYCKICSSFSDIRITDQAFVNKAGTFGDHPSCRSNKHLSSARHQESLKQRLCNKLSQVSLQSLIRISTEAPDEFSDTEYEFFIDELKRLNPKMRIDV